MNHDKKVFIATQEIQRRLDEGRLDEADRLNAINADLLAALEAAETEISRLDLLMGGDGHSDGAVAVKIGAAIAKAKGE